MSVQPGKALKTMGLRPLHISWFLLATGLSLTACDPKSRSIDVPPVSAGTVPAGTQNSSPIAGGQQDAFPGPTSSGTTMATTASVGLVIAVPVSGTYDASGMSFRFSYLNYSRSDKLPTNAQGQASLSFSGLPVNQTGDMTLVISQGANDTYKGVISGVSLKAGSNGPLTMTMAAISAGVSPSGITAANPATNTGNATLGGTANAIAGQNATTVGTNTGVSGGHNDQSTSSTSGDQTQPPATVSNNQMVLAQDGSYTLDDLTITLPSGWTVGQTADQGDVAFVTFTTNGQFVRLYVKKGGSLDMQAVFASHASIEKSAYTAAIGSHTWTLIATAKEAPETLESTVGTFHVCAFKTTVGANTYYGYARAGSSDTAEKLVRSLLAQTK